MLNTRSFGATVIALCGLALLAARPAQCSDLVVEPSADTYIMSISEGSKYNFGTDPLLVAYNVGGEQMNPMLQFNLSQANRVQFALHACAFGAMVG